MPATIPAGMTLPVDAYRWYIMYVSDAATSKLTAVADLQVLPAYNPAAQAGQQSVSQAVRQAGKQAGRQSGSRQAGQQVGRRVGKEAGVTNISM